MATVGADFEKIIELVKGAAQPLVVTTEKDHFIVLPGANGPVIESLAKYQHADPPAKKHAAVKVQDVAGFATYFLRYNDEDSIIFGNPADFSFHGVMDYHRNKEGAARLGLHTVTLFLRQTKRWMTWFSANKKNMPQEEFATFIEDNLADIWAPDGSLPAAADMLEISRTLEATSSYTFSQRTNLKSGERKLGFNETLNATAGPGEEMSIPDKFVIKLPIFLNQAPVEVTCRLRFRINGGKLTMWFDMVRVDEMLAAEFERARLGVQEATGAEILLGAKQ